jgi:indolepyruvate ferredoxin oxidoreductase alpha subunit
MEELLACFARILVIEETYPVIELQFRERDRVFGRLSRAVPEPGELLPEFIEMSLRQFFHLPSASPRPRVEGQERRPTLCAGCPHRAAFFAIKRAMPKAIFPSDIGCYTLGLNLEAVDTVLCMGASISQAAGFYHSYRRSGETGPPIAATIGDSTFFHAGIPALINAVIHQARFVLLILDNGTTAMTGGQSTPHSGRDGDGRPAPAVSLEELVRACGVSFVRTADPYYLKDFTDLVREADGYAHAEDGGIAVIISRHPCLMNLPAGEARRGGRYTIGAACKGCRLCVDRFGCPALVYLADEDRVVIDQSLCTGCGVCAAVCHRGAVEESQGAVESVLTRVE